MLSADEVVRLAELFVAAGVNKIRLTGGEVRKLIHRWSSCLINHASACQPLLRPDIVDICTRLRSISGLKDIGITTNGLVLKRMLPDLQKAGQLDQVDASK